MKKLLMFICAVMMVFAVIGNAHALSLITNGDFETGIIPWTFDGDVQIADTSDPWFTSAQGMNNYYALLGVGATQGASTLTQVFDATNINFLTITFNWAVNYWDASAAEDTFLSLVNIDGSPAYQIPLLELSTNGTFFNPQSGLAYGCYTNTIDISSYTANNNTSVLFRLIEECASSSYNGTESVAGIDNVVVSAAPVPEPSTILLLGSGLLGLVGYNRKRFSKKS